VCSLWIWWRHDCRISRLGQMASASTILCEFVIVVMLCRAEVSKVCGNMPPFSTRLSLAYGFIWYHVIWYICFSQKLVIVTKQYGVMSQKTVVLILNIVSHLKKVLFVCLPWLCEGEWSPVR
jgi:hypothetical protein